jgi:phosphate transport system substrate-binding protein
MARLVKPMIVARFFAPLVLGFLGVVGAPSPRAYAAQVSLAETGSTFIYPVFRVWATDYPKTHPGVTVTAAATESGAGVEQAISGAAQIGVSDAYMSNVEVRDNPLIINVPMAILAQTVNTNVPGLNGQNLNLDGPTLAGIYAGKIQSWDDPAIAAMNGGVKLPHNAIIPIRRSDVSGDAFIFTQYLTFTTPSREYSPGYGTTIAWPAAPNALTAEGNAGMIAKIHDTPYSIGYVGVSFHEDVAKAGIGTAALRSYDGEFLLPTPQAIEAAAAALWPRTPQDQRLTLVNAPGANAYPLINYEYAVVTKKQPSPETAAALRSFLLWAIAPDEVNAQYLANANFIPLPAHVWVLSHDQIEEIK